MKSVVFNIQRFSIEDGPGIRTTVFFKGCPLRCQWCSNPESQNAYPEMVHRNSLCVRCGTCVETCEAQAITQTGAGVRINRSKCVRCGRCVEVCTSGALNIFGTEMSVDEVLQEVKKDKSFYDNSGGGVTASGGEPLSQADFVGELFRRCQEAGINTCLETCGYADLVDWEKVLPHTDLVLHDLKLVDASRHRKATGKSNAKILENIGHVASSGVPIIIRIPIVPGINGTEADCKAVAGYMQSVGGLTDVELMPYHRYGESKYENLDRRYRLGDLESPERADVEELADVFKELGIRAKIVE